MTGVTVPIPLGVERTDPTSIPGCDVDNPLPEHTSLRKFLRSWERGSGLKLEVENPTAESDQGLCKRDKDRLIQHLTVIGFTLGLPKIGTELTNEHLESLAETYRWETDQAQEAVQMRYMSRLK